MVNKYIIIILILIISLVSSVFALPTTQAATLIGYNNVTVDMTGGTLPMYYKWGQVSGSYSWQSENLSTSTYIISGSPLLGNTQFYYKACDSTGCGGELSFTTLPITPQVQTTFGISIDNITTSHFKIPVISDNVLKAYFWLIPSFPSIVWGLLFMGIFFGLWIRGRDLTVPVILGLIIGTFVMFGDTGLKLGIPVEFQMMAQGLTYAALAGIVLAFFKRS
jgi:hypothetical protein